MSNQGNNLTSFALSKITSDPLDDNDPWASCSLGRQTFATNLTQIISTINQPFTIGISSAYGTGKTHFLNRLKCDLNKNCKTIYFNAWESDFSNDPFASFMAAFKNQLKENDWANNGKQILEKVDKTFVKITKAAAPLLLKGLFKKYICGDEAEEILKLVGVSEDALADKFGEFCQERLDNLTKIENGISTFKDELVAVRIMPLKFWKRSNIFSQLKGWFLLLQLTVLNWKAH